MSDTRPGRVIAVSLREAIQDLLPHRLDFYDHWLNGDRLRDRRDHLASMSAVLGFLRTEGDVYAEIVSRAGRLAAAWTIDSGSPWWRRTASASPVFVRARAALHAAGEVVRHVHTSSRTTRRIRGRQAEVAVTASLFCSVRDVPPGPLCGFYLAAALEAFARFGVPVQGRLTQCRAMGSPNCVMLLDWSGAGVVDGTAAAA